MVEGTSDVAYLRLASQLYRRETGLELLGEDLSIFAAGVGDEGGTYGISERFPTLFEMASLDIDEAGRRRFRVIALLDDDNMGRVAVSGISRGHRRIAEYESIYRLRRSMPLRAGSTRTLADKTKTANACYGTLDCVIEDLISNNLCSRFIKEMPLSVKRQATVSGTGSHRYWTDSGKRELLKFVSENAKNEDMGGMIGTLRALRSYLNLPPDGVNVDLA